MNDAARRDPAIMAKASTEVSTLASKNARAVAAIGEPESTMLAASQPNPKALAGLFYEKRSRITGASGLAPSLTMTRARIKIDILIRNKPALVARRRIFTFPKRRAPGRGRVAVSINSGSSGIFVSLVAMIAPHRHGLRLAAAGTLCRACRSKSSLRQRGGRCDYNRQIPFERSFYGILCTCFRVNPRVHLT